MSIIETLASFLVLSPAMRIAMNGANPATTRIFTLIFAFLAICVWLTFQFGFAIMLLKMTRSEYTNLGFLFAGFRCINPAIKVIAAFGLLISLLALISRFIAKFIFYKINPDFSIESISQIAENKELLTSFASDTVTFLVIFLGILFILSIIVLIRFVFVFQLHFDNPNEPILSVFRKSSQMMHKNVFRLILFSLRSGGKQLFTAIIFAVLVNFIPEDKSSGLSILTFIFDMIYFINLYTAMIRIYLTIPVLYEELLKPKDENS
jgi:hypothetical protein